MVGLLDIAELSREVEVRGKKIKVTGISVEGIMVLLDRFPEIRKIVSQRGDETSAATLISQLPEAVSVAIAAGCGHPGEEAAERVAKQLSIGEQAELLDVIFQLTFPGGIHPFVEKLTKLANEVSRGASAESGWGQVTNSPEPSKK